MLHLETHKYDGIVGPIYHQIINTEKDTDVITFDQSISIVEQWLHDSSIKNKTPIIKTINLFKNDRDKNFDPINDIHVEELLPRVIKIVSTFEHSGIDLFLQKLGEITELGSCPQGRTTRLLEFFIPYKS
jgi:hypothetical protein